MLLRIVSKSVFVLRTCSIVARNIRHKNINRISSNLVNSHFSTNFFRKYSSSNEEEEIDQESFYHIQQLANRYLAYDEAQKDELMREIESYENLAEVVKCIENNAEKFHKDHLVQLLLLSGKHRNKQEPTVIQNISEFVEAIDSQVPQMNDIELGICLLHLRLLGLSSRHTVMQKLIKSLINSLSQKKNDIDSLALSLFLEALCLERDLYSKLIMVDSLPVVNTKLDNCKDPLEFYHLISCLNNIHPILSTNALNSYKDKIEQFLRENMITSDHVRIIFKTINFLNYPHWSTANADLIQKFLLILQKSVPTMLPKDLYQTNRALYVQYEPSTLIPLLRDRANKLLDETQDVELLQIVCLYCTPQERIKYAEMLRGMRIFSFFS